MSLIRVDFRLDKEMKIHENKILVFINLMLAKTI